MNILVTQFYKPDNYYRFNEIKYCLQKNVENRLIDCVAVLTNSVDGLGTSEKIKVCMVESRPTYADHFDIGRSLTNNGIIVVVNSDIFINEDNVQLILDNLDESTVYALSRWDVKSDMTIEHHNVRDSQDCWVFRNTIKFGHYDIPLGIPGCDNRIAYELFKAGYSIQNPSRSIITQHYHLSNYRTYNLDERLIGEYYCVPPTHLES